MHVPKEFEIKDIAVIENFIKENGYRPCGHCMRAEYRKLKNGLV